MIVYIVVTYSSSMGQQPVVEILDVFSKKEDAEILAQSERDRINDFWKDKEGCMVWPSAFKAEVLEQIVK